MIRPARSAVYCPMPSVLDLIGDTPLVEVTQFDAAPCRLFLKLESANPSGSIKDRPARSMIETAEAEGRLRPGGTIVEATAGNTGLGLALVGARKGAARQGHGRASRDHPFRRRQGTSRLLSRPRRGDHAAHSQRVFRQPIR